ncbi:probable serine/threonine-protein kinase MARK-A [Anopheles aquasalis]|uniref:probable serine/threonine-protein kinase MARK-A n=1 Tax=Anopheles aquasalis TaxID=42839 RepID=UPI00215A8D95|nr:probable serine/threonine-protein kinase MARK-A [Anopheles aquasalis]
MSHHGSPPNPMDGVPVKISERFKPPPKLVLPQGVVNRLSQYDIGQVLRDSCYGGELEETVLKRMTEWRAIKQREREERNNRLRLIEQNRLRQIEAEQKQKLHQISYPNTDELSSASDDDDGDAGEGNSDPSPTSGSTDRKKAEPEDEEHEESEEEENDESAPSGSSDERAAKPYDHTERQLCSILVPTVIREPAPTAADALTPASLTIIPKTTTASAVAVCMSSSSNSNSNSVTTVATSTASIGCYNNNNNNNYNKINYSDFENDTSSPFDNMELRTINDLDILAQVLKLNTNLSSPTGAIVPPKEEREAAPTQIKRETDPLPEQQPPPLPPPHHQQQQQQQLPVLQSNSAYSTTPYSAATQQYSMQHAGFPQSINQYHQPPQTSISGAGVNDYLRTSYASYHQSPQQYATVGYGAQYDQGSRVSSGYPSSTTTAASESLYSMSNYSGPSPYNVPVSQQQTAAVYQPTAYGYGYNYAPGTIVPSTSVAASTATHTYAPTYGYGTATVPIYHGYQQSSSSSSGCTPTNPSANYNSTIGHHDAAVSQEGTGTSGGVSGLRSKSRSVPDILRQLNDEVQDSVARRTRNNSQTISDRHVSDVQSEEAAVGTDEKRIDYTKYNQLSPAEQNLVKRISSMGFPLERVVWVLQRIGNDDKKVIEHLIPLSELLDVGFEEEKISDALLKFGNNKHKALDYLIS